MLIANMVGKNESERFLPEVLEHLSKIVDVIVFTDDCSDDNTKEIASKYAHVFQTPEPLFTKDEGKLRSFSWSNLSQFATHGEDWILAIDCDEKLWSTEQNFDMLRLTNQDKYDVINIKFFHMWNEKQYRVDKLWAPNNSSRLFRFIDNGSFADRRLACGSEPTYVNQMIRQGRYMVDSPLIMQHLGYVKDEDKIAKFNRYMALDGGDFHQRSHLESIIDEDPVLIDWAIYA
jgi:glycosyltransferase involved in cell wall biosynthesis